MGTSTSSKGPGKNSPLVPPWADPDDHGPGPTPDPNRFQSFRINLGKFISSGESISLRRALGHYARTATGGHSVAPRRFGALARAGGDLFETLVALRDGQSATTESGFDLSLLNGQDTDIAIDTIVQVLGPENGDADRVRVAMTEALSECLDGIDKFDFSSITDEILINVLLAYVRRYVFQQIVLDSRAAFAKTGAFSRIQQAEDDLLELVGAATDKHMRPLLGENVRMLRGSQIVEAQLRAIREVWMEWEVYEQ